MHVRTGMLSSEGRCKTLDASADGYARGEAVGAMLLCPLHQAMQAEGPHVLAVLRGSAVGQDGRSSALTAPNGPAQQVCVCVCVCAVNQDGNSSALTAPSRPAQQVNVHACVFTHVYEHFEEKLKLAGPGPMGCWHSSSAQE